jgi:rRNA processing protein Gar1
MSPNGNIVVKIENLSVIGETVVDENLKPFGKVCDIFGPVSSPYASVKPTHKSKISDNKMLYVSPQKGERRRKKNERR